METRKVQTNRNSTHSISLPKAWADRLGIHHGSSLSMDLRPDGVILVYPPGGAAKPPVEWRCDIDGQEADDVERLVLGAYVAAYETLQLSLGRHAKHEVVLAACERACARVRGLVIVESGPHAIVLQDLLDPTDFNAPKGVHRMHLEAREMLTVAAAALLEGRTEAAAAVALREDELDRILLILTKQHRQVVIEPSRALRMGIDARESLHYLLVAQELEAVGDDLLELVVDSHSPLDPDARPHMKGAITIALKALDDAVAAFYRKDVALANETIRLSSSLARLSRSIPPKLTEGRDAEARLACTACFRLSRLFDALGRIGLRTKAVAEIAIDRAVDLPPPVALKESG